MPVSKIPSAGIDSGGVAPSNLSTGAPSWDSSGNLSFNSGYGSNGVAYGCRAWVNFNGTSTVAIRASGNVSSITDNGTGDYTVNFSTAMPDINYSVAGAVNEGSTDNALPARIAQLRRTTPTTSSFRVGVSNLSNSAFDVEYVFFQVFR